MPKLIHLQVDSGVAAGKLYSVPQQGGSLGRSPACTFTIRDDQLSREHCRFFFRGDRLWIADTDSSNGTTVNGQLVREARLHTGDRIEVGATTILVVHDSCKTALQLAREATPPEAVDSPAPRERALWPRALAALGVLVWLLFLLYSLLPRVSTPTDGAASPAVQPAGAGPAASAAPSTPLAPDELPPDLSARIARIQRDVAAALSAGRFEKAAARIAAEQVLPDSAPLAVRLRKLERLVLEATAALSAAEDVLLGKAGQTVALWYEGRRLLMVPRALANGRIRFATETPQGTELISMSIRELAAEDRLRFLPPPASEAERVLRCATLLQAGRHEEARAAAPDCGPLAAAFGELAGGG